MFGTGCRYILNNTKSNIQSEIDFLFLGGFFPKQLESEIAQKSRTGLQNAANVFQWHIINGIEKNIKKPIDLLSFLFVGSYPKNYSDFFIHGEKFKRLDNRENKIGGFLNLSIIKQLLLPFFVKRELKKWIYKHEGKKVIFIYSLQNHFLSAANYLKTKDSEIHICISVNDLPVYMSMDRDASFLFRIYKKWSEHKLKTNLKYIDSFMFVTVNMVEYFRIYNKPYVVIEGMVDYCNTNELVMVDNSIFARKNIILYTGTLTKKYGILDLVEAFSLIKDENYRLIICGGGETEEQIKKAATEDNRIKFMGLTARNKVLELQKEATVLVNPRQNNEEFTKYSFPYKMFEYLLSGKPIVCYKLDGFPEEYDNHFIYVNGSKPNDLAEKLVEACNLSENELRKIHKSNIKFVVEEKNNVVQSKKIIDMIKKTL